MGIIKEEKTIESLERKIFNLEKQLGIVNAEHRAMKTVLENIRRQKVDNLLPEQMEHFIEVVSKMATFTLDVIEERTK